MRSIIMLGLAAMLAACLPMQKPDTPEPPVTRAKPQRFDGLAMLASVVAPERDAIREPHRFDRAIRATDIDGLRYFFYRPGDQRSVVGFSFLNDGSPKVNPVGLKKKGARREYAFMFADRARENIHLTINDDVKLSGRFSHDNMFREMHFFPRKQLPTLQVLVGEGLLKVTLPTGEPVLFDRDTMEVVDGALVEGPIDFNRSRHLRHNPEVRYTGQYIAITVAQRGEAPRRAKVWGQTKFAEVHYPARYPNRRCKLSPKFIWDQRPKPGDNDPTLRMLHKTDDELFAVIEKQCGWNLAELKPASPHIAKAGN